MKVKSLLRRVPIMSMFHQNFIVFSVLSLLLLMTLSSASSDHSKDMTEAEFKAEILDALEDLTEMAYDGRGNNKNRNTNNNNNNSGNNRQINGVVEQVSNIIGGVVQGTASNQGQSQLGQQSAGNNTQVGNKDPPPIESKTMRVFQCRQAERQITEMEGNRGRYCCVDEKSGQSRFCRTFKCASPPKASSCCDAVDNGQRFCPGIMSGRCKKTERKYGYVDEKQNSARFCCITQSAQQRFCSFSFCATFIAGCCQSKATQNRICNGYMENIGSGASQGGSGTGGNNSGYGGNGFGNGAGQPIDVSTTAAPTTRGKGKPRPQPVVSSTQPPRKGQQNCALKRQQVVKEFKQVTDRFTETSNQIRTIEASRGGGSNTREATGGERTDNGQSNGATSTIMDVLSRIPSTVVGALSTISKTLSGLNAEYQF